MGHSPMPAMDSGHLPALPSCESPGRVSGDRERGEESLTRGTRSPVARGGTRRLPALCPRAHDPQGVAAVEGPRRGVDACWCLPAHVCPRVRAPPPGASGRARHRGVPGLPWGELHPVHSLHGVETSAYRGAAEREPGPGHPSAFLGPEDTAQRRPPTGRPEGRPCRRWGNSRGALTPVTRSP